MSLTDAATESRLNRLERKLDRLNGLKDVRDYRRRTTKLKQVAPTLKPAEFEALNAAARRQGISPTMAARRAIIAAYPVETSTETTTQAPSAPFTRRQPKAPGPTTKADVIAKNSAIDAENARRTQAILRDARPK